MTHPVSELRIDAFTYGVDTNEGLYMRINCNHCGHTVEEAPRASETRMGLRNRLLRQLNDLECR